MAYLLASNFLIPQPFLRISCRSFTTTLLLSGLLVSCQSYIHQIANCVSRCVPPIPPPSLIEHTYAKHMPATVSVPPSSSSHTPGYPTLSTKGCSDYKVVLGSLEESTVSTSTEIGHSIQLLSVTYKAVGTAVIMSGSALHGHDIPSGYCKVAVDKIDANVKSWPVIKGDDENLSNGSI